jgi:hypothetical protein
MPVVERMRHQAIRSGPGARVEVLDAVCDHLEHGFGKA